MCITCWRVLIGACDTLLLIWLNVYLTVHAQRLQMLFVSIKMDSTWFP